MNAARRRNRTGYTLIELLAVIAILVVVGGVLVPTLRTLGGDTNVKAGADILQARMAEARAAAIGEGRPYRVAVSQDGTRVRVAPDELELVGLDPTFDTAAPFVFEDDLPNGVTALPIPEEGLALFVDQAGWMRVVTFLPDGTCREMSAAVEVREPGCYPMVVRVRGLTGAASITPGPVGGTYP
jgi:prepilin-type N-terminal cleavage/methylation domain-containing protein